jgi:hypothetical protein
MAFQILAMNRSESKMASFLHQWSFPVALLTAWISAAVICLGNLGSMSASWETVRNQAQHYMPPTSPAASTSAPNV